MNEISIISQGDQSNLTLNEDHHLACNNVTIDIVGEGNRIQIGKKCRLLNFKMIIRGDNSKIVIGENVNCSGLMQIKASSSSIIIGNRTRFVGKGPALRCGEPNTKITMGKNCLVAIDVVMNTSDSHSILDIDTKKRINPPSDIFIGDHVWVGMGAKIWKNVIIGNHSIVASGAIVTKNIPEHCIEAGVPASVIKERITWDSRLLPFDDE